MSGYIKTGRQLLYKKRLKLKIKACTNIARFLAAERMRNKFRLANKAYTLKNKSVNASHDSVNVGLIVSGATNQLRKSNAIASTKRIRLLTVTARGRFIVGKSGWFFRR